MQQAQPRHLSSIGRKWCACRPRNARAAWPDEDGAVIKILPSRAISITVRVPFRVAQIEDLVAFHDLQFSNGSLHEESAAAPKKSAASWSRTLFGPFRAWSKKRLIRYFALNRRWSLMTERRCGRRIG